MKLLNHLRSLQMKKLKKKQLF